jgi:hypothetical protein
MRVRIVRQPTESAGVDGVRLEKYLVGSAYDLPAIVANYLVAEGFAIFEGRKDKEEHRPADRRGKE